MPEFHGKYNPSIKVVRPVEGSVTHERIFCLFDGKPVVNLKRHLLIHYNMQFEDYIEFCGLPSDYPDMPERSRELKEQASLKIEELRLEDFVLPPVSLGDWPRRTRIRPDEKQRAH